jgi:hypothetical protein
VKKFLFVLLLFSFTLSAYAETVRATGYGKNRRDALNDALISAVQQAVGIMIETSLIVKNQELIEERISARSEGFVDKYEILYDYDGKTIVLDVSVKTGALENLRAEIIRAVPVQEVYSKESVANLERQSSEGMEFELEGKNMVARRETLQRLIKERQEALRTKSADLFDRLLTTRQIAEVYFKEEESRENLMATDFFRVDLSFNQVVNKVRYSAVIYEFHKLFMSVGAKYTSYPLKDLPFALPPNTVVLVDINDTCREYTFEEITFEGLTELHDKFYLLNYRTEIVLNFIHVDKNTAGVSRTRKVSSLTSPTKSSFFTTINRRGITPFVISAKVVSSQFYQKLTFDTEELREVNLFTVEYPAATLDKNAQVVSKEEKAALSRQREYERAQSEDDFFDSFNSLYGRINKTLFMGFGGTRVPSEVDDLTNISSLFTLSFEYDRYFINFPIFGLGFSINIATDSDNSSDYYYKNYWDISYERLDLLALARIPITPIGVNLHAIAGIGYADFEIKDLRKDENYKTGGLSLTYGLGIEKYFFEHFNLGFRYKFSQFPEGINIGMGENIKKPLEAFEIYMGISW